MHNKVGVLNATEPYTENGTFRVMYILPQYKKDKRENPKKYMKKITEVTTVPGPPAFFSNTLKLQSTSMCMYEIHWRNSDQVMVPVCI